eukprot:10441706-Prorocentrum_lima.AAC.1
MDGPRQPESVPTSRGSSTPSGAGGGLTLEGIRCAKNCRINWDASGTRCRGSKVASAAWRSRWRTGHGAS